MYVCVLDFQESTRFQNRYVLPIQRGGRTESYGIMRTIPVYSSTVRSTVALPEIQIQSTSNQNSSQSRSNSSLQSLCFSTSTHRIHHQHQHQHQHRSCIVIMSQSAPDNASSAPPTSSPMVALLGPKLLKQGKTESTDKLLKDKQLVALYFSASWCPPCKAFSPVLIDFYRQHASKNGVEIIYLSSDSTVADFQAYYAKMPWLALPRDDASIQYQSELAAKLKIQGIPTLIVLDVATGGLVTREARREVQKTANGGAAAAAVVVEIWKRTPPLPMEDAIAAASAMDPLSLLKRLVSHILKNPIYIFGILYIVKQFMRTLSKTPVVTNDVTGSTDEPIPEDEF